MILDYESQILVLLDENKIISFEYIDFLLNILVIMTHRQKNSRTELTLMHSTSPMDPTTSQNVVIVAKSTIMPRFTMVWL